MRKVNLLTEEFVDKLKNNWLLITSLGYICLTVFGMIISYLRYIVYGVSIFELVDIDEFLIIGVRHLPLFILSANHRLRNIMSGPNLAETKQGGYQNHPEFTKELSIVNKWRLFRNILAS